MNTLDDESYSSINILKDDYVYPEWYNKKNTIFIKKYIGD